MRPWGRTASAGSAAERDLHPLARLTAVPFEDRWIEIWGDLLQHGLVVNAPSLPVPTDSDPCSLGEQEVAHEPDEEPLMCGHAGLDPVEPLLQLLSLLGQLAVVRCRLRPLRQSGVDGHVQVPAGIWLRGLLLLDVLPEI